MKHLNIKHYEQGFTLLELVAVAAIIGILVIIGMPNYYADYTERAKRSEPPIVLGAITSYQMEYKLRTGTFVSCPLNPEAPNGNWNPNMPEWNRVGFKASGKLFYQYEVRADKTGFTAYARASSDSDLDDWKVSSDNLAPEKYKQVQNN
ncbi:MAG: prepilin-type N-terminal cleavage/methylation domain-containing protein [Desulfobacterales bacterium]|nr:prepilin-type N-terminal cleavage/methylation domain-containing protein [Desulfobacterales bacterium]